MGRKKEKNKNPKSRILLLHRSKENIIKNLLCNQLNITEKIEATYGTKLKLLFLHPDESQFFGKVVLLLQRIESLTNKIVAYTIQKITLLKTSKILPPFYYSL